MYAVGRIPRSFFRGKAAVRGRESSPALIDPPCALRSSRLRDEVQVVETILALNPEHLYEWSPSTRRPCRTMLAGLPFSGPMPACASP